MSKNKKLNEKFFAEQTQASRIKSKIVSKYLDGWSLVIGSWAPKMIYADFFAGCGRYNDGKPSTPLESIANIAGRDKLRGKVQMIFNEFNDDFNNQLANNVYNFPDTKHLLHKPIIQKHNFEELPPLVQIRNWLELSPSANIPPSLVFVDPWGYKGLSLSHLGDVLKMKGCEVIFFFNYNRINGAIPNSKMSKHMDMLFGEENAAVLREQLLPLKGKPAAREARIIKSVKEVLRTYVKPQPTYVQEFKFKKGNRVSHFVIFATTHPRGFSIMKDVMASESASYVDGFPRYDNGSSSQIGLFGGVFLLADELLRFFANKTLSALDVFEQHQVLGPYTTKNYKDALLWLEEYGKVTVNPERAKRRLYKGNPTMGDPVMISFKDY